jgi:hypothetical protein
MDLKANLCCLKSDGLQAVELLGRRLLSEEAYRISNRIISRIRNLNTLWNSNYF